MLTILIYVVELIRRGLRKILRATGIVFESFREAQDIRRSLPRVYVED